VVIVSERSEAFGLLKHSRENSTATQLSWYSPIQYYITKDPIFTLLLSMIAIESRGLTWKSHICLFVVESLGSEVIPLQTELLTSPKNDLGEYWHWLSIHQPKMHYFLLYTFVLGGADVPFQCVVKAYNFRWFISRFLRISKLPSSHPVWPELKLRTKQFQFSAKSWNNKPEPIQLFGVTAVHFKCEESAFSRWHTLALANLSAKRFFYYSRS